MARVERVAVGRVGRPHGVGGEVRVDPLGGLPRGLRGYPVFYLGRGDDLEPVEVISHRQQGRFLVVLFAGCSSPEDARRLTHSLLYVRREDMPALGEGEYYHVDLLGCSVVDESKAVLGVVEDVFAAGGHDVMVIRSSDGEWMLPVAGDFVVEMNLLDGVIVVRPPQGIRS